MWVLDIILDNKKVNILISEKWVALWNSTYCDLFENEAIRITNQMVDELNVTFGYGEWIVGEPKWFPLAVVVSSLFQDKPIYDFR